MRSNTTKNNNVDFDLHGVVGIRLVNPTDIDVKNISKLLSQFRADLTREPDITIVYEENWQLKDLSYLGLNDAAFNNEGFYILSSGRSDLKVRIPFEQIGDKCEIVCEQGIIGIPLLHSIINLTFLKKNYLPIHASAFSYNDINALVVGWTKGGKTEALFSFINHGARFIGDETVIISADGRKMFGIPVPVSIWEWQFSEIPDLMPPLSLQKRILFKGVHFVARLHKLMNRGILKNNPVVKLMGDSLPAFKRQLSVRVPPENIFNGKVEWGEVELNRVILAMSRSDSEISVNKGMPDELYNRIINSSIHELEAIYKYYYTFKFAFPSARNEFLERVETLYRSLLPKALSGVKNFEVFHPYPVSFEKLYLAMKPIFENEQSQKN